MRPPAPHKGGLSRVSVNSVRSVFRATGLDETENVVRIAELTNTSKHHVAKVMQRLAKDGFVSSQRGPSGGFTLKKNAKEISFLDIYESIEGKIEIEHCFFNTPVCPLERCIMNNITNKMSNEFIQYLKSQTLDFYI